MGMSGRWARWESWVVHSPGVVALAMVAVVDGGVLWASQSWVAVVVDALVLAGALLVVLGHDGGLVVLLAGLGLGTGLPAAHVGLGVYAPLVVVMHLVWGQRWRPAGGVTLAGVAAGLWSSRRAGTTGQWHAAVALWAVLFVAAWLVGWMASRRRVVAQHQLAVALEDQRRQIVGELHDNVAHDLSVIVMRSHHARLEPGRAGQDLEFIGQTAARANRYLRNLMDLMQPAELVRPLRLSEMLRAGEQQLVDAGRAVSVTSEGDLGLVPQPVADGVARVLKEAVNNMVRHASGDQPCLVVLSVMPGRVSMGLTNGCAGPVGSGLGLTGMRQRVEALGGTFHAGPSDGSWMVRVTIPW